MMEIEDDKKEPGTIVQEIQKNDEKPQENKENLDK